MGEVEGTSPSTPDETPTEAPAKGKIVASYLVKVHIHGDAGDEQAVKLTSAEVTNDQVKEAVIEGVVDNLGWDATVSLIERTDSD